VTIANAEAIYPVRTMSDWLDDLDRVIGEAHQIASAFAIVTPDLAPPPDGPLVGERLIEPPSAVAELGGDAAADDAEAADDAGDATDAGEDTAGEAAEGSYGGDAALDRGPEPIPTVAEASFRLAAWQKSLGNDVFVRVFGPAIIPIVPDVGPSGAAPRPAADNGADGSG